MRLAALLTLWVISLAACEQAVDKTQPIQFSHKLHTEKGLPCTMCHQSVETATFASLPRIDDCMTCHQGAITESPEEEKIRQYAAKGMEIPWQRVYQVPGHVYFSHRRHVTLGGLDCAACHGDVKGSSVPVTRPAVVLDMKACMDCHQKRQASNDCDDCHR